MKLEKQVQSDIPRGQGGCVADATPWEPHQQEAEVCTPWLLPATTTDGHCVISLLYTVILPSYLAIPWGIGPCTHPTPLDAGDHYMKAATLVSMTLKYSDAQAPYIKCCSVSTQPVLYSCVL
jgi:hypothetical protein